MRRTKDKIKIGNMMKSGLNYIIFFVFLFCFQAITAQTFSGSVKGSAIAGQNFKIVYILENEYGQDIQDPQTPSGLRIIYGPGISITEDETTFNGKTSRIRIEQYTYTAKAEKEGTYTIPPITIKTGGKNLKSNPITIRVLPANTQGSSQSYNQPTNTADKVNSENTFVRAILSKSKIFEQEAVTVTFKAYSTYQMAQVKNMEFPEFEGSVTEDLFMATTLQNTQEVYQGKAYHVAELKKIILFPQRSGKITIPSGRADIVVVIRSGRQVQTIAGRQNLLDYSQISVKTTPLTVNIEPLPDNKPSNFANAVGSFTVNSDISSTNIMANEGITLTVNIKGTGNLKLIKTPEINLPADFEIYDPKITYQVEPTSNGLSGTKKIEYFFIPRQEGEYKIPETRFSYFDIKSGKFNELTIPSYTLNITKDPSGGNNTSVSFNNKEKDIYKDIREVKTKYKFKKTDDFFFGTIGYWLWYIISFILLTVSIIYYKNKEKQNADVVGLKTKRANKIAHKRLNMAGVYLKENNKEKFYEEILRATWGYLSDKLSIPVANLSRENVESEMNTYGISKNLIVLFIHILDTCEFARYAPADSHEEMDNFYGKTIEAIEKMENSVRKRKK